MPMPDWLRVRRSKSDVDVAQWEKCPKCSEVLYRKELAEHLFVCSHCGHHFRMHAFDRVHMLVDGDFVEIGTEIRPGDPLHWVDKRTYPEKLAGDRAKSSLS
jgi:acetyl-CoA carboxylase carboxyl transferase subunit beta